MERERRCGKVSEPTLLLVRWAVLKAPQSFLTHLGDTVMFLFCSGPQRGVSRSSRTRVGMRWTRPCRKACGTVAYGQAVWSCPLDAGVKLIEMIDRRRRLTSPRLRGEHGAAVKTIAQGMPDCSAVPVVTLLVCFFLICTRGCGCALRAWHSLRPYCHEGKRRTHHSGAQRAAGTRTCVRLPGGMVDSQPTSNQNKFVRRDGRSGRIRTCDPCFPKAVLYRAEPHSDLSPRLIASGVVHRKKRTEGFRPPCKPA